MTNRTRGWEPGWEHCDGLEAEREKRIQSLAPPVQKPVIEEGFSKSVAGRIKQQ